MGSDDVVKGLRDDTYRVNFKEIGAEIDAAFGLDGFMERFLNDRTREALHGYAHGGIHQLGRRFRDGQVRPNYADGEIVEIIRISTSALFMVTNLLTKHFGFEDDWKKVTAMYAEWGQH
jgi:hypothetical protein